MKSSTGKILTIVHKPINVSRSKMVLASEMAFTHIGRVCFRGDSRAPQTIFEHGFKTREVISETLFWDIKKIHKNHLKTRDSFDSIKFLKAMKSLKNLIQSDASDEIVKGFEPVSPIFYEAWIESMLNQVKKGELVVSDAGVKKGIYSPFESQAFVSVSKRFKSSLLFPVKINRSDKLAHNSTYVYAVYVEKGYDVHMQGIISSLLNAETSEADLRKAFKKANPDLSSELVDEHIEKMLTIQQVKNISLQEAVLIYAEEIVTKAIPTEHIIAAIKIERQTRLLGKDKISGVYEIIPGVLLNDECHLAKDMIKQVENFLQKEIELNNDAHSPDMINSRNIHLPEPDEGFKKGF